jgi:GT2 family glycosyltransferase
MTRPCIFTAIAYDEGMNLGAAYNRFMDLVPEQAWACFLDHDAMFTTVDWYSLLADAIVANPKAGLFTAMTNRIGNPVQLSERPTHDIRIHRPHGRKLKEKFAHTAIDVSHRQPISGVLMCISKQAWEKAGHFHDGFFGVDNQIHLDVVRAGYQVLLLKGLYVYHWYRADGEKDHLKRLPAKYRIRPK